MSEPEKDAPTSAELGRTYGEMLGQQDWEPDERTVADSAPPEVIEPAAPSSAKAPLPPPRRILEALLFVGGEPLSAERAGQIMRGLTPEQFAQAVDALNSDYRRQGRPYRIVPRGQGHVLTLQPRYRDVVEKLYGGVREARLSPAAIDVLALLAYRQPATKSEIDGIRGAESGALLRQLVRRGLASVTSRGDADRREVSYGTTSRFLELFGLRSLDDLPRTQDVQQL